MSEVFVRERFLHEIVPFLTISENWKNTVVTGLAVDSRKVQAGNCFIAYPGHHSDGRDYLRAAFSAGAGCALVEAEGLQQESLPAVSNPQPVIPVPQLQSKLGVIAALFYGDPSTHLKLLAITGTNGKTSVSQLVAQALDFLGQPCGVIGTLGNGLVGRLESTANTTPDVVESNRLLAEMLEQGASFVTMETSSHGLVQGRVDGLSVYSALVTNISRDHLDYHGTMEAYAEAKTLLARHPDLKHLILNFDDQRVAAMAASANESTCIWTFSQRNVKEASVVATAIEYSKQGMAVTVQCGDELATIHSSLIGEFNGANLLAALTMLLSVGISLRSAAEALSHADPVVGRMQRVHANNDLPMVVVDFAHTPDALEKALLALRRHTDGKIWCVFGCGGERDSGKRPLMAEVVAELADEMIITADNPRSEKLSTIVSDMVKGIPPQSAFQIIEDRATAVAHAIVNAAPQDVILVAGKGHENYQEIQGAKLPYSDGLACEAALQDRVEAMRQRGGH